MSLGWDVVGARSPLVRGAGCGLRSAVGARRAENWLSWSASGAAGRWRRLVLWGSGGGVAAAVVGRARRRLAFFVGRRGVPLRGSAGRPVMGDACRGGGFIVWSTVPGFCLRTT